MINFSEQHIIQQRYWKEKLQRCAAADALPVIDIHAVSGTGRKMLDIKLPAFTSSKIRSLCNHDSYLVFTYYLSVLHVLIYRYTSQQEIFTMADMPGEEDSVLIGSRMSGAINFKTLFSNMKQEVNNSLAAIANIPAMENWDTTILRNTVCLSYLPKINNTLSIQLMGWPEVAGLEASFDPGVMNVNVVENFLHNFQLLLSSVVQDPYCNIGLYKYIHPAEVQLQTITFNRPHGTYGEIIPLMERFNEVCASVPDAPALREGDVMLGYSELDHRSSSLSHYLVTEQQIKKGMRIGVLLDRSIEQIIVLLGILKSGGILVPLDPHSPAGRITSIIADSGMELLITSSVYMQEVMVYYSGKLVVADLQPEIFSGAGLTVPVSLTDACYILYTSGSTGQPKGVMISHGNISNYIRWANHYYFGNSSGHCFAYFTSIGFDLTLTSIFTTLLRGDILEILGEGDAGELLQTIFGSSRINTVKLTPSHVSLLEVLPCKVTNIRKVIIGGEVLQPHQVRYLQSLNPSIAIYNEYGPTETTVGCSVQYVQSAESITIGSPVAGNRIYILGSDRQLVPLGVEGEIAIAGSGVGMGYYGMEEESARRFISIPRIPESRIYLTGDRGRWSVDGELIYCGRQDRQLKVHGFRIEPGEIESVAGQVKGISEVVVTGYEGQLICYYRSVGESVLSSSDLKHLLPDYMLPHQYIRVSQFTLTSNGKVDYSRLPVPGSGLEEGYAGATTAAEELLVNIWETVLGRERIGVNDNFFTLGGDSIRAISLVSHINQAKGVNLEVKDIFNHQTIRSLLLYIQQEQNENNVEEREAAIKYLAGFREQVLHHAKDTDGWEDVYPLSDIETGMIFHNKLQRDFGTYHDQFFYQFIDDHFNLPLLQKAFQLLADKHDILRSRYVIDAMEFPYKVVMRPFDIGHKLTCKQLTTSGREVAKAIIEKDMEEDRLVGFGNESGLWRIIVYELGQHEIGLLFSFHHAIIDGWSRASLITALNNIYQQLKKQDQVTVLPLKATYKDYVLDQLIISGNQSVQDFWEKELSGAVSSGLPFRSGKYSAKQVTHRAYFGLDDQSRQQLLAMGGREGINVKHIAFSVFLYLIHLTTLQDDVLVGLVTDGRPAIPDGENIIGCFLNSVPFRLSLKQQGLNAMELIEQVNAKLIVIKGMDKLSLVQINKRLNKERGSALFDVLFSYVDFHIYQEARDTLVLDAMVDYFESTNTNFDFGFGASGNRMGFSIAYNPAIYTSEEIARFGNYYLQLLACFINKNDQPLSSDQIVQDVIMNHPQATYGEIIPLMERFNEVCTSVPDATALREGDVMLGYSELGYRSSSLSHYLVTEQQIKKGMRIGVLLDRSIEQIIVLLGILKSGGILVPLDPHSPAGRITSIIVDSGMELLITSSVYMQEVMVYYSGKLVVADLQPEIFSGAGLTVPVSLTDACYILYTSGSTGQPKGVMISHGNISNYIHWANHYYFGNSSGHCFAYFTSIGFDLTLTSIFTTLLRGDILEILGEGDAGELLQTIFGSSRINTVKLTPSHVSLLEVLPCKVTNIRKVIIGGEVLQPHQVRHLQSLNPSIAIYNEYGPTETTVGCSVQHVQSAESITIGAPVAGNRIYILGSDRQRVLPGVEGEIAIAGAGVGMGYYGMEEESARRFISIPRIPESRIYLTGDRGRWSVDGELIYCGRQDRQLKVHGFRIEPGEIESVAGQVKGISEVVVTGYEGQLICYYRSVGESVLSSSDLKHLLPDYMLPHQYIRVSQFTLTSNGKVDYSRLPVPGFGLEEGYAGATTAAEELLVNIWETVLGRERIGVNDNFFTLGGDSIIAIQVCSRVQQKGFQLEVSDIFNKLTIRSIAAELCPLQSTNEQGLVSGVVPLTPIQRRFFSLYTIRPEIFYQTVILQLHRPVALAELTAIMGQLLDHHDALRMEYDLSEYPDNILQVNRKEMSAPFVHSLGVCSTFPDTHTFSEDRALSKGPLFNVATFFMEAHQYLLLSVHHLIIDGVSWRILLEDLDQLLRKNDAILPAKSASYKEYAVVLLRFSQNEIFKRHLQELDYLHHIQLPVIQPELDADVADLYCYEKRISISVPVTQHEKQHGGFIHIMTLALWRSFMQCFRQEDFYIAMETHGREGIPEGIYVGRTVGWFTGIYPVYLSGKRAGETADSLEYIKETINKAVSTSLIYNIAAYLLTEADRLKLPIPAICFNYLGQFSQTQRGSFDVVSMQLEGVNDPMEKRAYQFDISAGLAGGELIVQLAYNEKHFRQDTLMQVLQVFRDHFLLLLSSEESEQPTSSTPELTYQGLSSGDLDMIDDMM